MKPPMAPFALAGGVKAARRDPSAYLGLRSVRRVFSYEMVVGRVMPRVHSALAEPTFPRGPEERRTPQDAVVVRVPLLTFNSFLKRYFEKTDDVLARVSSELDKCFTGDLVLLRKEETPEDPSIVFRVQQIIDRVGQLRDPFTNELAIGHETLSDLKAEAEMYGEELNEPDRSLPKGRLMGDQDLSQNVNYHKWNEFAIEDPYHKI